MGPHPATPLFQSCSIVVSFFKVLELCISDNLFNCKVLEMELLPMDMGQKQMVTNHINRWERLFYFSCCVFMLLLCSNEGAGAGAGVFKGYPSKPNGKT